MNENVITKHNNISEAQKRTKGQIVTYNSTMQ